MSTKKFQLFNRQHWTEVHRNAPFGDKTIKKASQGSCYFGVREELGLGAGNSEASRMAGKVSFFDLGGGYKGTTPYVMAIFCIYILFYN